MHIFEWVLFWWAYLRKEVCVTLNKTNTDFLTPSLPEGVFSNRPCLSVHVSVFKYLRDRSLVFSETLQFWVNKVKKVTWSE